jgi:hypothetical protein
MREKSAAQDLSNHIFMRIACEIAVTAAERRTLTRWASGQSATTSLSRRALMILLAASGRTNREIAVALRADVHTVGRWRKQFLVGRLDGIKSPARNPGLRRARANRLARRILKRTFEGPCGGVRRWTTRTLARELGVSHSMIQRVWKAAGINAASQHRFDLQSANLPRSARGPRSA